MIWQALEYEWRRIALAASYAKHPRTAVRLIRWACVPS